MSRNAHVSGMKARSPAELVRERCAPEALALPLQYVLAVSGGADSIFLLEAFAGLARTGEIATTPVVFHLDHGLREDSYRDLELVADACRRLDLAFYYERRNAAVFAERARLGLEAAGRVLRYRALARLAQGFSGGAIALTAHHADDYVESALIHLTRGGGPAALGSLPLLNRIESLWVLRPLVYLRAAEIRRCLREAGVVFREDPSNQSREFLRNRLRQDVLPPLLREGLDPIKLWRNFHGDAEDELQSFAREARQLAAGERAKPPGQLFVDRRMLAGASPGQRKALLDLCLRRLGLPPADRDFLNELQAQIQGRGAARATERGFRIRYERPEFLLWCDESSPLWIFRRDSPALQPMRVDRSGPDCLRIAWNGRRREYRLPPGRADQIHARAFEPGMQIVLSGAQAGKTKKLKKLLMELSVPAPVRAQLPLLVHAPTGRILRACLSLWESGEDRVFAWLPGE